ncbi:tripartite tricarboxylate transporter TctB family protein [Faunimonas sp. B44]|uniref:tripartite tricarboxylate transporter TctB family protein n=1 Tax=Faunimonas sp. B44 TaxID=3461493 RepID=UPI0040448EC6
MTRLTRAKVEHLLFLAAITACTALYMLDAWGVSRRVENLIVIVPFGAVAIALCVLIAARLLRTAEDDDTPAAADAAAAPSRSRWARIMPLAVMALIGAYSFLLEIVGFDVVTFAFVALALLVQGDRNLPRVLAFSAVFTFVVIWGSKAILTVPIPTLLG